MGDEDVVSLREFLEARLADTREVIESHLNSLHDTLQSDVERTSRMLESAVTRADFDQFRRTYEEQHKLLDARLSGAIKLTSDELEKFKNDTERTLQMQAGANAGYSRIWQAFIAVVTLALLAITVYSQIHTK